MINQHIYKYFKNKFNFIKLIIILFIIFIPQIQSIQITNIIQSIKQINSVSQYTYYIERDSTSSVIPSNSYFQISIPPQYINLIQFKSGKQVYCSSTQLTSSTLVCIYESNKLTINNAFLTSTNLKRFSIILKNITNPFPAKQYGPFQIILFDEGNTILQAGIYSQTIVTTAGLSTCSITNYVNNMANKRGSILINYKSKYVTNITNSYKMRINMNNYYQNDPLSTNINATITGYSSFSNIGSFLFQINYTTNINMTLLMPPSTQGANNFITVKSYIENNGDIDSCIISIDTVLPNSISINMNVSSYQVQKLSNYTFEILTSSPIFSTDSLVIQFPIVYDITSLTQVVFTEGILGNKTLNKENNIVTIKELTSSNLIGKTLKFNLNNINNPFDLRPISLTIKTLTKDLFIRDSSTYSITLINGKLTVNSFTCNNYQIGYKTNCKINFTLSNSLKSNGQIRVSFPTNSWMTSQSGPNTQCNVQSQSTQLNSLFQCRFYSSSRNFIFSQFTSVNNVTLNPFTAVVNFQQSSIDIDHRVQLPWSVQTFSFSVISYSYQNYTIDTGSFSLTTTKREIFQSQNNSINFDSTETLTPSKVLLTYNLPYDKSVGYQLKINLPLTLIDNNNITSIITSYGTFLDYNSSNSILLLKLSDITFKTQSFQILGFNTYISTKPIVYTLQFIYSNVVYFHYSQSIAIPNPKQIYKLLIKQSSSTVYAFNTLQLTISQLSNEDIIKFSTLDYMEYLTTNQSQCSNGVINCNLDGTLTVKNANNLDPNLKLTNFRFQIRNQPFVGSANFSIIIYDSTKNYFKQKSTFIISVTNTNTLNSSSLNYLSTNPYFNETTTLKLTINLFTPNSTVISINLPKNMIYYSSNCIQNCYDNSFNQNSNQFQASINGINLIIEFQIKNGLNFDNLIQVSSRDNFNRNRDYGTLKLQIICNSPCRSCSNNNKSNCLSCYAFESKKYLSENQCLTDCLSNQYPYTNNSLYYCKNCSSKCLKCTSQSICTNCIQNFNFLNNSCLQFCPSTYYSSLNQLTNIKQCKLCYETCLQCSIISTNCSKCISGYYLYNNSCRNSCPPTYYILEGKCIQCNTNCISCQDQTAFCLTCNDGYYLYDGKCYNNCPISGYTKNITSGKCEPCPSPCLKCGQFITNCTKCSSGTFLLGTKCLSSCTEVQGYYNIVSNNTCGECLSPCKSCSTSASYCTSCISGKVYFNHQCLAECPSAMFPKNLNNNSICTNCTWPCLKCLNQTSCQTCKNPYVLNVTQCANQCSSGYFVNSNSQCQICPASCKTCNSLGCLSCTDPTLFLYNQSCVSTCSPIYKNQMSMICENCRSPCQTCSSNSTSCQSCIDKYSFYEEKKQCVKSCPSLYFNENYLCKKCTDRNQYCKQCYISTLGNNFVCSQCQPQAFVLGYICIGECPAQSKVVNGICISLNCSNIADCQTCSDTKCITCKALYTLVDGVCQFRLISAVSEVPVPFPFLILIICTIISSFLLKFYFNKMYIPLYLYSFCGLIQAANIVLWTLLSIWTSSINLQQSIINIYFATLIICAMYVVFNITNFFYSIWISRNDKKYKLWYKQDNNSCSIAISILSLSVSFRFQIVKFSKLGNKQNFSAILQSKQKYLPLNILAISSIFFISIPSLILSAYLAYRQIQMNYLFFTSLEIALVSVIMIILSVLEVLTPNDYILEKKNQYKRGFDSQNFQGKSVEELMLSRGVVEEQYHEGKSLGVLEKQQAERNQFNTEYISSYNDQLKSQTKALKQEQKSSDQSQTRRTTNIQVTKPIQTNLELDQFQKITSMIQNTLKRKTQLLDSLINDQNNFIIQEVNENFPNEQHNQKVVNYRNNLNGKIISKPIGMIMKQLIAKYQYIEEEDEDSLGEEIQEIYQDLQFSLNQIGSNKLIKLNKISSNNQPKLKNHQELSLQTQLQYKKNKQKKQRKQKNQHQIEKIKNLVQQLHMQQLQEQILRQRLLALKQKQLKLTNQQYEKIKQKMQRNRMNTQQKLTKLSQMFIKRKIQNDKRKKEKQTRSIHDQIMESRKIGLKMIQPRQLISQPSNQIKLIETQTKKIKIQEFKQNIKKNNKISTPKFGKRSQILNNKKGLLKQQKPDILQGNIFINVQSDIQSHQIEKINNEMIKPNKYSGLLPINSKQKSKQFIKSNIFINKDKIYQKQKQYFNDQSQYEQIQDEQNILQNQQIIKPLQNDNPMIQDQLEQFYLQEQPNLIFQNDWKINQQKDQKENEHNEQNAQNNVQNNVQKNQQLIKQLNQQKEIQQLPIQEEAKKKSKIQFHYGRVQTMDDYQHWPIDPQLQEKILQVQRKANKYLIQKKEKKRPLTNKITQKYQYQSSSEQKQFLISGQKTRKYTDLHGKSNILDKGNSIFDAQRDSEIDLGVQNGQMLIFEDQEVFNQNQIENFHQDPQSNQKIKRNQQKITLHLQSKEKIPKKRVNRSIINLSPGKY